MKLRRAHIKYILIAVVCFFVFLFWPSSNKPTGHPRDYKEIKESGILRVATEYNSISFYVDNDTLSGFNYELINAFAESQGLKAEIIPIMSFEERLIGLEQGDFDIIAYNTPITSNLKDTLLFSAPILLSKYVLVQRKPNVDSTSVFINSQLELSGCTLYVTKASPAIMRIRNLGNEIGDTIYIREFEKYGPEQLISLVAYGDIDYAVCEANIAESAAKDLPQIDIKTDISFNQFQSWALSKHSPILLDSLNLWLINFIKSPYYKQLQKKYYDIK